MICGLNKLFDQFSTSSQITSSMFWKNIGSIRIFYSEKIVDLSIHEKGILNNSFFIFSFLRKKKTPLMMINIYIFFF